MKVKLTEDDCRSCGACCVSTHNADALSYGYADLTEKDVARRMCAARASLAYLGQRRGVY